MHSPSNEVYSKFCEEEVFKDQERRMIWCDQEDERAKAWGCPRGSPKHISRKLKRLSLGCPRHPLLYQKTIRSSLVKLYFNSDTSYVLYLKRLFVFVFVIFILWIKWILAFLCGRETRSAFSYEYSYSSFIFVEYSSMLLQYFQLLFFMHLLFRAVSFLMLHSHIS